MNDSAAPSRPKRRWLGRVLLATFDLVVLGLFAAALRLKTGEQLFGLVVDDNRRAALQIVVGLLLSVRVLSRLTPLLLNVLERTGPDFLVAVRQLRARKRGFLKVISVLSMLAVSVSSCALTTTLSVMGGFREDLKRKILGNNPHVVVESPDEALAGWQPLLARIEREAGVKEADAYVHGEAMLSSATNLSGAEVRGITTGAAIARRLRTVMTEGSVEHLTHPERIRPSLSPTDPLELSLGAKIEAQQGKHADADVPAATMPGIILGKELARSLRVLVGDQVSVVVPFGSLGPTGPMPRSRSFRVAGIIYTGMYEYDVKTAYITLEAAQNLFRLGTSVTGLELRLDDVERAPQVAERVRSAVRGSAGQAPLIVRDWQELNQNLFGALQLEKLVMFVALGIAILVASFCIVGTLTLMVQEKSGEVAVLKAIGCSNRRIRRIFMLEGTLIGLFGACGGLVFGFAMAFAARHYGIHLNPEVYYIDRLPVNIDAGEFALVAVSAALVSMLATVFPARMASVLRPVEALRYD